MNDRDLHDQAAALFLDLRELTPEERTPRLLEITNEKLRSEVTDLLDHDSPATQSSTSSSSGSVTGRSSPIPPGRDFPSSIGPYTVLRRIGRGGSGYVLLAEQHQPIHRLVAIKIVPYAAINPESAARFEFERRALERTDHPNIARILDAGRTPDGLPYLVIEYVEGKPLSDYCREKKLGLRERISLVLDIADAVQHAHQRGVIHRDLKPANILTTEISGRAVPRVLDFGIAKPTEQFEPAPGDMSGGGEGSGGDVGGGGGGVGAARAELGPTTGFAIGTPAFMAPEQTGGRAIDTRADIYALGAVLYHLVAGRPPIDTTGEPLEVLRRIKESIPLPVSKALIQARAAGPAAHAAPGPLPPRAFLNDLNLILAKALEKVPARRYQTVAAFAEDLRRLLQRQPILAHPPSFRYRAARFAQRHRALVAASVVIAAAALLGIGGLTFGLLEANRQRREAYNQTDAQREINKFLTDDILAAASPDKEGHKIEALDLVKRASSRIGNRFQGRPLISAAIHHTLGVTFAQLGSFPEAESHLATALALRRQHSGPDAPDTVRSEIAVADLLVRREMYDKAEPALLASINRARLILGADDIALYTALNDLGVTLATLGRGKEAIGALQDALAGAVRLLGDHDVFVLETTSNLAQAYDMNGDPERSLKMHLDALRVADSIPDPPRMILIGLNNNIGATYLGENRDKEAIPYLRRAAELAAKWLSEDDPNRLTLQGNLASLEAEVGDPMAAAKLFEEIRKARTRILGPDSHDTMSARYGYWNALWIAKKFDEAAAGFKELLPDCARALGENNWVTIQTRSSLALALKDGGHLEEALPYAERAAAEFLALYGPDHPRTRNTTIMLSDLRKKLAK